MAITPTVQESRLEIDATIRGRRSIRRYSNKSVPEKVVCELLDLARHAPSSMNGQPWHFIVVRQPETKRKLVEIKNRYCPAEKKSFQADFLLQAPVVLVICVDRLKSHERDVENAVLAASMVMLAAHARGLGSVYMSAYQNDEPQLRGEIRRLLAIPSEFDPITLLPLGYPDEVPVEKQFRPLEETVHYEQF
jgi:nitroreductase